MAVAVVRSPLRSAAVLQTGVPLVNDSEAFVDGVAGVQLFGSANVAAVFRLYPGYFVQTGSVWVLCALGGDPAPAAFSVAASVKTLRRALREMVEPATDRVSQ